MKKIIALTLVFLLVIPTAVFAAESDSVADVLSLVKERLSINDTYDEFSTSSYQDFLETVHNFFWSNTKTGESVNVSCTQKGVITSYHHYIPTYEQDTMPFFVENLYDVAIKTANDFLKKVNPELFDKITINEPQSQNSTSFYRFSISFDVLENGIKVSSNNGYISLNKDATLVESFQMNFTDNAYFESPDGIISADAAKKAFEEKLGLRLVYKMYVKDKEITVYPAYIEKETSEKYIDAATGEIFVPTKENYITNDRFDKLAGGSANLKEEALDTGFSQVELEKLEEIEGLISKNDAEKLVRDNGIIKMPKDFILQTISLTQDYYENEKYIYNLYFTLPEKNDEVGNNIQAVRASVNAKDGEIISFYKNKNFAENKENVAFISTQKAEEIANNTLASLSFDNKTSYLLNDDSENKYNFTYTRHVNGIPFLSNTANVSIDEYSGEVISWSISKYDVAFPSLSNVIDISKANERLFEQVEYEPLYLITQNRDKKETYSNLVYAISSDYSISLDATDGTLTNYYNEPYGDEETISYTDIEGHYAKEKIDKLSQYNILVANRTEFRPNDSTTQAEFLAYLLMTFENNDKISLDDEDDILWLYRRAKNLGYIKMEEENPNGYVTRQDAAVLFIRALGLVPAAECENVLLNPFSDVADSFGYPALLYGMNVVRGDGSGNFYPKKHITNAELAVMLYNFLSR